MSNTSAINVLIGGNATQFYQTIGGVQRTLGNLSRTLDGVAKNISASISLPLTIMGTIASTQFAEVEKGLREVNSLLGLTGDEGEASFKQLQAGAKEVSKEIGLLQSEVVPAMYDAISAGVPKDNVFEFLKVAGRAAIGGVTDIKTSVNGLTTVVNAFNLDFQKTGEVADSIFAAVQGGKTTFDEMAKSLFNVAPAAAAANVTFQEVNAAIATLTAAGTPTSVATTQIRAALTGLQKPSKELDKIFRALGFTNAQTAIESKGLGFALEAVKAASAGNNGTLQTLLGSTEAVSATLVLAGTSAGKFADELDRQAKSAGSATAASDEVNKSRARGYEQTKVLLSNISLTIGESLAPYVDVVNGLLQKTLGIFDKLNPSVISIGTGFGVVLAIIPPLIVGLGQIIKIVTSSINSIKILIPILSGISAPVLAIAAAVGAAVFLIITYWDEIKAYFTTGGGVTFLDSLKQLWDTSMKNIQDAVGTLVKVTSDLWDTYGESITAIFSSIGKVIMNSLGNVIEVVSLSIRGLATIFSVFAKVIRGDFKGAFDSIKSFAVDAFSTITKVILSSFQSVLGVAATVAEKLGFETIADSITSASDRLDVFKRKFTAVAELATSGDTALEVNTANPAPYNTTIETSESDSNNSLGSLKKTVEAIKLVKTEFDITSSFAGKKINEIAKAVMDAGIAMHEAVKSVSFSFDEYMKYFHDFQNGTYVALEGFMVLGDGIQDVFVNLLESGKLSFQGLFKQISLFIAKMIGAIAAAAILSVLVSSIFGGASAIGSAFSFGNLAAQFSGGLLEFGGGKADGGNVNMGTAYMVGERGREVFVPTQNGTIIPNDKLGGGINKVEIIGTLTASGSDLKYVLDKQNKRRSNI
ncbi:phage tail tape measure protein [Algoriphagus aquimarinus]|uniref:phage tail tape measure protein n=1 Tax=Algoriphagus aquimarinus TaxID=237018 RepID=UPI0030D906A6|tara:strand:- start:36733 stop:39342 length:2610 start_codon:yes stop_codon:yes gene_type:complete